MKKKNLLLLLLAGTFSTTALQAQTPPSTWQEHWFEHNQLLNRVYYDNDLALYFDNDVSSSVTWPRQYLGDVWRYTKRTYGSFGTDPHLFAVFHTNKYSGGHPSGYFDASHDNRNVIDVGPGPWNGGGNDYDLSTHEVAHIVEGDSKNSHGSPAFGVWGDSKWAEIFNYDVYVNLGRTADATRWYNLMMSGSGDNFPRPGTKWFKDWFYPIYNNYGGNKVLNRYFIQLALYFPKSGNDYSRGLNMGEFVHFWSGAAGVNLKSLATTAFGWTAEYEAQFVAAQSAFPFTYTTPLPIIVNAFQDINYGGYGVALPVGSYNLAKLRAYGAVNDDITSMKVAAGYKAVLYADDNFTGASTTITGDVSLLDVANWNDKVSSMIISTVSAASADTLHTAGVAVTQSDVKGEEELVLYPNPVSKDGIITVNVPKYNAAAPVQVQLVDLNKHVVSYKKANAKVVTISTNKASSGFYILIVTNGTNRYTKKVLIQ